MFILHRTRESKRADEILWKLEDLVAAHKVSFEPPLDLPENVELPVLVEGDDRYTGDAIDKRLDALESDLTFSRQISADACYVDPDNPADCL